MDSLDLIQTFREVARRGSFSATARALDMSPANVSKYIAQLEQRFGVRLFNRTTRKVSLTDAGQQQGGSDGSEGGGELVHDFFPEMKWSRIDFQIRRRRRGCVGWLICQRVRWDVVCVCEPV